MKILILTGMLASGKSIALRMLQDLNYYCIDNIPPALIRSFVGIAEGNAALEKVALVVDMRAGVFFTDSVSAIEELKRNGNCEVLFFDADDEVLIQRYKTQRRRHLLAGSERIEETIAKERASLAGVRELADYVIDTSTLVDAQLKHRLTQLFTEDLDSLTMRINIVSFGFKYGILKDADIIMDVRFLPNPFYDPRLKKLTGLDKDVIDYVLSREVTREFLNRFLNLVHFLIPNYKNEGKSQLIIGIGCTGGRHRSTAIATRIAEGLAGSGIVNVSHRDIAKDIYE